jgi:hypothetical protein
MYSLWILEINPLYRICLRDVAEHVSIAAVVQQQEVVVVFITVWIPKELHMDVPSLCGARPSTYRKYK